MSQITRIDLRNQNLPSRFAGTGVPNSTRVDGNPNNATFEAAVACIADKQGNLYVTDSAASTSNIVPSFIRKIDPNGFVSTFFTSPSIKPHSLGFDINDNLLMADYAGGSLWRRTDSTTAFYLADFASTGSVVRDPLGNLFVAGANEDSIYWLNSGFLPRILAGRVNFAGYADGNGTSARFNMPREMVFDSKGRFFVADQVNSAIRMISWQ